MDHQSVPTSVLRPMWFLSPEVCDLEVQTDASKLGYGIWFLQQGLWDSTAARLPINVLETTAFWNFLACILPKLSKQCNTLWRVDNTTALAYVKKVGGTCSPQVLVEAEKILVKAHQMFVRILPVFIPMGENILADAVSRFQEIPDWQLHPFVFRAIAARWGLPMIDLFASNASKQTQRFYSWDASNNPEGVALSLHNLHIVAWRISGGSTSSRTSLATPEISTRQGGANPQRIDTMPGNPSRNIFVPPTFHSIKLV
jgi:hypothetical protein